MLSGRLLGSSFSGDWAGAGPEGRGDVLLGKGSLCLHALGGFARYGGDGDGGEGWGSEATARRPTPRAKLRGRRGGAKAGSMCPSHEAVTTARASSSERAPGR